MVIAIALTVSAADAQISVRIRPHARADVRPARPSRNHVWVSGEWNWNNGNYEYSQGHWAEPERGRRVYVEGHWRHTRRGWTWVPGHWR